MIQSGKLKSREGKSSQKILRQARGAAKKYIKENRAKTGKRRRKRRKSEREEKRNNQGEKDENGFLKKRKTCPTNTL